jgi:hypothetical protein
MDNIEANVAIAGGKGSITLEGNTYLIEPLTDKVTATLHNYFRKNMKTPLASILDSIKDLPDDLKKIAIQEAVRLQSTGVVANPEGYFLRQMLTPDGAGFFLWLLLKNNHPEMTHAACIKLAEAAAPEILINDIARATGLNMLVGEK